MLFRSQDHASLWGGRTTTSSVRRPRRSLLSCLSTRWCLTCPPPPLCLMLVRSLVPLSFPFCLPPCTGVLGLVPLASFRRLFIPLPSFNPWPFWLISPLVYVCMRVRRVGVKGLTTLVVACKPGTKPHTQSRFIHAHLTWLCHHIHTIDTTAMLPPVTGNGRGRQAANRDGQVLGNFR